MALDLFGTSSSTVFFGMLKGPSLRKQEPPTEGDQIEKEEPQPQVVFALGFVTKNLDPSRLSI
jgi:hypothetical protein